MQPASEVCVGVLFFCQGQARPGRPQLGERCDWSNAEDRCSGWGSDESLGQARVAAWWLAGSEIISRPLKERPPGRRNEANGTRGHVSTHSSPLWRYFASCAALRRSFSAVPARGLPTAARCSRHFSGTLQMWSFNLKPASYRCQHQDRLGSKIRMLMENGNKMRLEIYQSREHDLRYQRPAAYWRWGVLDGEAGKVLSSSPWLQSRTTSNWQLRTKVTAVF